MSQNNQTFAIPINCVNLILLAAATTLIFMATAAQSIATEIEISHSILKPLEGGLVAHGDLFLEVRNTSDLPLEAIDLDIVSPAECRLTQGPVIIDLLKPNKALKQKLDVTFTPSPGSPPGYMEQLLANEIEFKVNYTDFYGASLSATITSNLAKIKHSTATGKQNKGGPAK